MAISLTASPAASLCPKRIDGSSAAAAAAAPFSYLKAQFPSISKSVGRAGVSFYTMPRKSSVVLAAKKQTYSDLDDLLAQSEKPVLVDFYATWCGPCQFMVPVLNEVSIALKEKIQVVKIDTEKYPSIADKYRIEALPTFILFKDGVPSDRFEGALTADQLIQRIEDSLKVKQ
ncbi:hypothetical protein MLD38_013070 [Melastoma candidum]|uniref:Uncharacterized protein n=1 Tax=Melastoma candidum TaxID=119954 RepID=A0ACB9R7T0_9MYRT|nr:hypothetical protein MLD38_013070 [Melastoma candidum]